MARMYIGVQIAETEAAPLGTETANDNAFENNRRTFLRIFNI